MADWTEKYRPTTREEIRGNDSARDELWEWAETWDDHQSAVILHGSPGVGKTSAAHALANDMGWETVELNASDQRTEAAIERFAGRAARNATLAGAAEAGDQEDPDRGRQLVIMDEADDIHYQHDRGGKQAVTELVEDARQPIVLVANEAYEMARGLRNACESIEFRDVSARSIRPVLRDIARHEDIAFEAEALAAIAERNSGDLRGAIRDLQAAAGPNEPLTADDVVTAGRDRTRDVYTFLDAVLKEATAEEALRTAYETDETPDDLLRWVTDKVPMVYEGTELADAFDFLAAADRWLGRVRATQNYSYWRYATDDIAAGVAAVRRRDRDEWTRYGGPPYWSTSDAVRDHVARDVATAAGTSIATARQEILPFLETMTHHCRNRELTVEMAAAYDLEAEHVAFVTGSGEQTDKVQSIVAEAAEAADATATDAGEPAGTDASTGSETDETATTDTREAEDGTDPDEQSGLGDFV